MMAPVPLLTENGRWGLSEGTFAAKRGKGRDTPQADTDRPVSQRQRQRILIIGSLCGSCAAVICCPPKQE
jgi:hypothetical protein